MNRSERRSAERLALTEAAEVVLEQRQRRNRRDPGLESDSDGILCPECGKVVPVSEVEELVWAGHGPPPSGTSGRGGEWRAVEHRREPGVDR